MGQLLLPRLWAGVLVISLVSSAHDEATEDAASVSKS